MANITSTQSPLLRQSLPIIQRLGIETPIGLPEYLPEPEMTSSRVVPDKNNKNFLGLYYRVVIEALTDCANVTLFMRGSFGFEFEEPDVADKFQQFLIIN